MWFLFCIFPVFLHSQFLQQVVEIVISWNTEVPFSGIWEVPGLSWKHFCFGTFYLGEIVNSPAHQCSHQVWPTNWDIPITALRSNKHFSVNAEILKKQNKIRMLFISLIISKEGIPDELVLLSLFKGLFWGEIYEEILDFKDTLSVFLWSTISVLVLDQKLWNLGLFDNLK